MSVEFLEANWSAYLSEVFDEYYDQGSWPFVEREDISGAWKQVPQWLELRQRAAKISRIYDIGAGHGFMSAFCRKLFPEAIINALEIDLTEFPLWARRKYDVMVDLCNISESAAHIDEAVPESVDVVLLLNTIQYLKYSPVQLFKLFHKVLSPTGVLYVSCPDSAGLAGKTYQHVTGYKELPEFKCATMAPAGQAVFCEGTKLTLRVMEESKVIWEYSQSEICEIASATGFKRTRFGTSASCGCAFLNFEFVKNF